MTTEAAPELTEMTWDPITMIVGSLGIYTKIDFKAKRVAECHSTSSIFRGYSIFMKGKDPRDAHFITSRICGICGDNHATCSVYNQNMAYGVRPPHLGEWIINLGESAEYMFDHNIFQEILVVVDFFYAALPGYGEVGRRRADLVCWGSLNDPEHCDFRYENMTDWGRKMFVTPGVIRDGKLLTNDLVEINLGIRILLGSSYYEDWEDQEMFVTRDPLGNPVDRRHPWNQHTIPRPAKRDFDSKYSWVMSPRWFDGKDHLACDTGGGPIARLWATALGGLVDFGYVKSTGSSVQINLPKTVSKPPVTFEWKIPVDASGAPLSNAIERDRARTYFQAYAAACALYFTEKALAEIRAGRTKTWEPFSVPDEANSCGFTEAVRGVLSHHMVIRGGKIANYHPYPPTPWNASVRDSFGTPGPYEDAVQNTPIFEENPPETFKGIDIMRTVRSFDPCLPCGVHMYLGNGAVLDKVHSPYAAVTLAT